MVGIVVIISGTPTLYKDSFHTYKATDTGEVEVVKGRILSAGSVANSLHIIGTDEAGNDRVEDNEKPLAIGDIQKTAPPLVSEKPNSAYAKDGEYLDYFAIEDGLIVDLPIKTNEVWAVGDWVFGEAGTGLAQTEATATELDEAVGYALEVQANGYVRTQLARGRYIKPVAEIPEN